jgi:hypothetical protein
MNWFPFKLLQPVVLDPKSFFARFSKIGHASQICELQLIFNNRAKFAA